ncbi:DUF397 domain-containing protein [Streptomyces sp. NPDC051987]|uniref:DUF397 domain-containing protein n=1 Tax=Streptomyces sp. NPDC051987 TaxID=3155808 RepID=UPI0034200114
MEIATAPTHTRVRDSKAPGRAALAFPAGAFAAFLAEIKRAGSPGRQAPQPAAQ